MISTNHTPALCKKCLNFRGVWHFLQLLQRYGEGGSYKKKFAVSTQHYSFAVKAFVDVAKKLDMSKYELAIRETKTMEVIQEVSTMKSEIGV